MCTKYDAASGNFLRRAQNGKMRLFIVLDRDCFRVPASGKIRVVVDGVEITVLYNRYTNLHVFDDGYLQCCGRLDVHDPTCRIIRRGQPRQIRAPQPGPAVPLVAKFTEDVITLRKQYAAETAAALFHHEANDGYLPDFFRGQGKRYKCALRTCYTWVYSHGENNFTACVPCNDPRCKSFPCAGLRAQHPRALEMAQVAATLF